MKRNIILLACLVGTFGLISCGSDSEGIETNTGNDGSGQTQTPVIKSVKATKALFTGITVNSDDQVNYLTFDLDASQESATYVEIEDYEPNYTYQLQLTGVYTKATYTIGTKETTIANNRLSLVAPISSTTTKKMYFDLASLNIQSDFYTAVLLEVESENKLSIENKNDTDTRSIRFVDQGSSDFYTTIRASRTSGAISSTGHPKAFSVKVVMNELSVAKAYINSGETHRFSYYGVSDKKLIKTTASRFSSSSSSINGGTSFYTVITFISPKNTGILPGDYLVRMEVTKPGSGIIKTSPFQKFKVSN